MRAASRAARSFPIEEAGRSTAAGAERTASASAPHTRQARRGQFRMIEGQHAGGAGRPAWHAAAAISDPTTTTVTGPIPADAIRRAWERASSPPA